MDYENEKIVFFDGVCNLCSAFVQFILKNERTNEIIFAPLQSDFAKNFFYQFNVKNKTSWQPSVNSRYQSVYFYTDGTMLDKSSAALEIIKLLRRPYSLLRVFKLVPKFLRDFVYTIIANNRYRMMGKRSECWLPHPKYKGRFVD